MGPTASGKSQLALELAIKYKAAIINCDSLQVYRGLDIGTAKPSIQEMGLVPHYLFSYVDFPKTMTAGEYCRDFYQLLREHEHPLYFLVGGTGFYFQAIEKGMYPVRAADPVLNKQLELELQTELGAQKLWNELVEKDPIYAKRIHPADHYRIARAIELMRTEKKSIMQIQQEFSQKSQSLPFERLKIGCFLEKQDLAERILRRTQHMTQQGIIEETMTAIEKGWGDWSPLTAVGYREVIQYLRELQSQAWLEEHIYRSTLQLAKKQRTWFQRDSQIHWHHPVQDMQSIDLEIQKFIQN